MPADIDSKNDAGPTLDDFLRLHSIIDAQGHGHDSLDALRLILRKNLEMHGLSLGREDHELYLHAEASALFCGYDDVQTTITDPELLRIIDETLSQIYARCSGMISASILKR